MVDEILKNGKESFLTAVAHGYYDVAQQADVFGTLDRRTTKYIAKLAPDRDAPAIPDPDSPTAVEARIPVSS